MTPLSATGHLAKSKRSAAFTVKGCRHTQGEQWIIATTGGVGLRLRYSFCSPKTLFSAPQFRSNREV